MNAHARPADISDNAADTGATPPRHFLELADFDPDTLRRILALGATFKRDTTSGSGLLAGKP